jgi:flagella basal body P-ring formation protein FlgA
MVGLDVIVTAVCPLLHLTVPKQLLAVKVELCPIRIPDGFAEAVTLHGTLTVTVAWLLQVVPPVIVQVAVYEVVTVGETVIEVPADEFDHETEPAHPVAVKVLLCPWLIVVGLAVAVTLQLGGLTVTVAWLVQVVPPVIVQVAVYEVVTFGETVIEVPADEFDHETEPAHPVAVKVLLCPWLIVVGLAVAVTLQLGGLTVTVAWLMQVVPPVIVQVAVYEVVTFGETVIEVPADEFDHETEPAQPVAVKVLLCPWLIVVGLAVAVTLQFGGLTVTVVWLMQVVPPVIVQVAVYEVVTFGETVIEVPADEFDHETEPAHPVAVKVLLCPWLIVVGLAVAVTLQLGGLTVTVAWLVQVVPPVIVQVAVYEVVTVGETVIEVPADEFDHETEPAHPVAVNVLLCPWLIVVGLAVAVTLQFGGLTVTVAWLMQVVPPVIVQVAVYKVVTFGETVIEVPDDEFDHETEPAQPVAVKVLLCPWLIVVGFAVAVTLQLGGLTVTVAWLVQVVPPVIVQVAVYEVVTVGETVIEVPVDEFDHETEPAQPVAVKVLLCPWMIVVGLAVAVTPQVGEFTVTVAVNVPLLQSVVSQVTK